MKEAIDIEKIVLGLIIKRGGDDAIADIKPEYFQNPMNKHVFNTIKFMFTEGKIIDVASVGMETKEAAYVVDMYEYTDYAIGTKDELDKFVLELKKMYAKRKMVQAIKDAYKIMEEENVLDAKSSLIASLEEIDIKDTKESMKTLKESLIRTAQWLETQYKLQEKEMLLTTHLPSFNRIIGGLMPENLIFIAARPSVGKTAFAMDIARHIAGKGRRVLFVTLEMSDIAIATRYVAGETKMDMQKIRTGRLDEDDWAKIGKAIGKLSNLDIVIDDISKSVSDIKIAAKEMKASGGLDLIIVDYIQLLQPEGNNYNREQEVASISRGLKRLAMDMDIPVIALSQLGRQAEGKKPVLSDLRESGSQEQDADVVVFLWEPDDDYFREIGHTEWIAAKQNANSMGGRIIELVVAKQRNGPLGAVYLAYFPAQTMFMEATI